LRRWNSIVEGLAVMSKSKDISKKRFSDFLAARLRARRGDKTREQPVSPDSRPIVAARSEQTTGPVAQS
jgi:hypothetical protein